MTRVAILGGGIAGLAAAYELEQQRRVGVPVDWHLFEAGSRFGGTVHTTRLRSSHGEYILEDGPDGWVTEKPWARELAQELGLGHEVIACNEAGRKTYVWQDGALVPMPDGMRMMVPEDLSTLEASPLFSPGAREAYANELARVEELKRLIPADDESVADFVRRHFGEEVLQKIGAPLLSGVFGGDTTRLSVRAVMPVFVRMEKQHGSLIAGLRARPRFVARQPTFTSLRRGMGSLVEALVAALPGDRLHTGNHAVALSRATAGGWLVRFRGADAHECSMGFVPFDRLLVALPPAVTRDLLYPVDAEAAALIPTEASSAVLATFCWQPGSFAQFALPPGFGFLVPQPSSGESLRKGQPRLLAGTFSAQKFPDRAPEGGMIIRAFFGGEAAQTLSGDADEVIAAAAFKELARVLPGLPPADPAMTTVVRWPRSLPQYEVGHLERMQKLQTCIQELGNLSLLGNGYHGVGVPDLIRDARAAARNFAGKNNE